MNLQTTAFDELADHDVDTIIAMAWEDDTPFEAIAAQFGLPEQAVIELMRRSLKTRSFRVWRIRVRGRMTKHQGRHMSAQREQISAHSSKAVTQALQADQDTFPLPPLTLSRESLR